MVHIYWRTFIRRNNMVTNYDNVRQNMGILKLEGLIEKMLKNNEIFYSRDPGSISPYDCHRQTELEHSIIEKTMLIDAINASALIATDPYIRERLKELATVVKRMADAQSQYADALARRLEDEMENMEKQFRLEEKRRRAKSIHGGDQRDRLYNMVVH